MARKGGNGQSGTPAEKPRLNSPEIVALVGLHLGSRTINKTGLYGLAGKELACYAEGWKLTYTGKQLARHLTGTK